LLFFIVVVVVFVLVVVFVASLFIPVGTPFVIINIF